MFRFTLYILFLLTSLQCIQKNAKSLPESEIRLPFVVHMNNTLIQLSVNNAPEPVYFIFDTGSEITAIYKEYAQKIKIVFDKSNRVTGVTGSEDYPLSTKNNITLAPGVVIENVELTQMNRGGYTSGEYEIQGIIGAAILKNYSVEINFDENAVILRSFGSKLPEKYQYSLPITHMDDYFPRIQMSVVLANRDTVSGSVYFDSGAQMAFLMNSKFAAQNEVLAKSDKYLQRNNHSVNETSYNYVVRANGLNFGKFDVAPFAMDISLSHTGVSAESGSMGLLGFEVIKRFNTVIDFSQNKMHYYPSQYFKTPMWFPVAGIILEQKGQNVYIHQFVEEPADTEKLKPNDRIISINGELVTSAEKAEYQLFSAPPESVFKLVIERRGISQPFEVEFKVEPML
ncbi:MAG: aspartyl protease family protein [Bacteroidia bacterium]|nr:aspartyl protease family protein [Bacteroidia bacterium]